MPQISTYKIHNGTTWVEYYFRTSAAAVGVDTTNQFVTANTKVNNVGFTLTVESGVAKANLTLTGANIANGVTGQQHNYIVNGDEISDSLIDLDVGMGALKAVTDIALTTNNYSTTLDSVYQAKDADLTAIAALSGTSGLLKKTAANTWALDTTAYVPGTRTVNGKALSSDIVINATEIPMSSASGAPSVATEIQGIIDTAAGHTTSYVASTADTSANSVNHRFTATSDYIDIQYTQGVAGNEYKLYYNASSASPSTAGWIDIKDLRIGDIIYLEETDVPDRWVASITVTGSGANKTYTVRFYTLEVSRIAWSDISGKPTTISGYGITDAKITTSSGAKTITLGSNTYTATSSNPTASWGSAVTVGTVGGVDLKFTMPAAPSYQDTKNTVGNETSSSKLFIVGAATTSSTSGSYAQSYANTNVYIGTDNCLYSNGQRVVTIVAGTTAPTNPQSGDIWIDTTSA